MGRHRRADHFHQARRVGQIQVKIQPPKMPDLSDLAAEYAAMVERAKTAAASLLGMVQATPLWKEIRREANRRQATTFRSKGAIRARAEVRGVSIIPTPDPGVLIIPTTDLPADPSEPVCGYYRVVDLVDLDSGIKNETPYIDDESTPDWRARHRPASARRA